MCDWLHCMFINLPGLCPQENGWHHRLQERGHKHWLLPPGGRTGWPPDWRRTSLFLRPHQGHLQEGDWPGKVTAISKSVSFWPRPVSYQRDLQKCMFSVVMIPLWMVVKKITFSVFQYLILVKVPVSRAQKFGISKIFFWKKWILLFTNDTIKLISAFMGLQEMYMAINAFLFKFLFINKSWKMYHDFHKNINPHICFQYWCALNQHVRMTPEASCDSKDWTNWLIIIHFCDQ